MSTVAEIKAALPGLTDEELQAVEHAVHALYFKRKAGLVLDESYANIPLADLIKETIEAFKADSKKGRGDAGSAAK